MHLAPGLACGLNCVIYLFFTETNLTKMKRIFLFILTVLSVTAFGQKTIKGKVIDAANNNPLFGANILLSHGGTTSTDKDGYFTVDCSKASVITISFIGYETVSKHAGILSAKQIEDWKDLTPSEKTELKAKRKSALISEFGIDGVNAEKLFKRISSDEERSKLPDVILKDIASAEYLNTNVLSKIVDNPGITADDRKIIKEKILEYYGLFSTEKTAKFKEWFDKNNAGVRY